MLVLICAILAQGDPNYTYQNISEARKSRAYQLYQRNVRTSSSLDSAVESTAEAMALPKGTVRLIILEESRQTKLAEEKEEAEKEEEAKKGGTSSTRTRNRSSSSSSRSSGSRKQVEKEPEFSGDGLYKYGRKEVVKIASEEIAPFLFREQCWPIVADMVPKMKEKEPFVIDGTLLSHDRKLLTVEITREDGYAERPLLLIRERCTSRLDSLDDGDPVRLYGWIPPEADYKDQDIATDGYVFFAVDADLGIKNFPDLEIKTNLDDQPGDKYGLWEIETEVTNTGSEAYERLEFEINVIDREYPKPDEAIDYTFFYLEKLEPGESKSVTCEIPKWTDEEVDAQVIVRILDGRAARN